MELIICLLGVLIISNLNMFFMRKELLNKLVLNSNYSSEIEKNMDLEDLVTIDNVRKVINNTFSICLLITLLCLMII